MQFFIPHIGKLEADSAYQGIIKELESQFRLPILDHRIFSLSYTNSRKKWYAEVGQLEEQEGRYQIVAILESKQFIVFTHTPEGKPGPIILVDKDEVTSVENFDAVAKSALK
jgi:hypothetical protein